MLHKGVAKETHIYIRGRSGARKTSLVVMSLLLQDIRGHQPELPPPPLDPFAEQDGVNTTDDSGAPISA